jgi:anionic cell wall polymer biosynthesis LytR-Cps2A-Psr (LCP) family protein
MNDLFIIIVCIILMLIIWGFYFKSIREGNDPNAANYTMPISFTGEKVDKNEKITIPQIIQTNNNENMTFNNDVNMTGHVNMQEKKFVTFGKGDAISATISANNNWGGRNELEIVGVGSCSNGCN